MKNLFFFLLLTVCFVSGFAQSDTIFTRNNKSIPCKIVEISESEFKYKMANLLDGPVYVISRTNVIKYTLSNGYSEILQIDEMSIEQQHLSILDKRNTIKIHLFSLLLSDHVSIELERVLKVGTNLQFELGYINSSMRPYNERGFVNHGLYSESGAPFCYGFYTKTGIKFLLGQDFSVKGIKYAHPLKGKFIRLDMPISFLHFDSFSFYSYRNNSLPYVSTREYTTLNSLSFGPMITYGKQFILGNLLTMEGYVSAGYTTQISKSSNSNFKEGDNVYRYGTHVRMTGSGISANIGLKIGYITKSKNPAKIKTK